MELSKVKKEDLNEILRLTKEQKLSIESEDLDGLNRIIGHKDKLMKKIDLLDLEFLDLYNKIKEEENIDTLDKINSGKYRNLEKLKRVIEDINFILKDITLIDNENTEMMKANLEDIKSGLKHVKKVQQAYKGYNYEMGSSILIDEKK